MEGTGDVHNMQNQICIRHLFKRRSECGYEIMRQLIDKAYRIRKQCLRAVCKRNLPHNGIKRCKELIRCVDIGIRKRIQHR